MIRDRGKANHTPFPRRRFALTSVSLCLALLLSAITTLSHAQQKRDQDDAVRLHADLVVVNVTVTDANGQYAHGLSAKDFAILEDGAAQKIESFDSEEAPFAAAILIDMSGSMEYKFSLARAAAASFLDHIREDDQVAVYGFNNQVKQFQDFSNVRDITEYIWDAEARDQTRLYDCMDEAIDALSKRPERRRALLVISDGWDSMSRKATYDSALRKAMASGVLIYTIDLMDDAQVNGGGSASIGLRRGRRDMQEFASQSGARYIHSPQGDKLEEAFTGIVEELRNQYTLTYYSTNDKRDGRWRKLNVSVSRPGLTTRARRGYYAPKG
ncbi:MAG TPA: VWA domain-containing protein [Blastocatellia bacterium]|nr:VWA domain-containing protein [Blastocatellia bacterium]